MKIPCDTIARLSHVLPLPGADYDPAFNSIRLDNGKVMVSNRCFMAVEEVQPFEGVFYIRPDAALIEQCRTEAQWSSLIEFTPIPSLKYTTAITTMGYKISENIGVWPAATGDFDLWRERVMIPCLIPLTVSGGPLSFSAEHLRQLAASSPSGEIVFEQYFDKMRPTVVRDINSHDWCGFFIPDVDRSRHLQPATVPGWCK